MVIKKFEELSKDDTQIAGGKGSSLSEMIQNGISVPDGFVILSNAFDRFLEETDLNIEIDSILHTVDIDIIHTVEDSSEKIQSLILNLEIPKDIVEEIKKEFKKLNSKFVAVRSSATAEDSLSEAWAGQLDSFLNTTEKNLLENVRKCWASLFTPRAIFYRFEKNLHKEKISVAVVVQKMVESEKSGVAFSVHPVTEDRNQMIIEAGFGLGEAIVSGSITPDSYVVEKEPRIIIDKNINIQNKKLIRAEGGGNNWVDLTEAEGKKQVLTEDQILKLSKLILKIENQYRVPQDIEWAIENDKFYIVQSRPITTLKAIVDKKEQPDVYKKIVNRAMFLVACELWYEGEKEELPEIFDNAFYFEPLFEYLPRKGVSVYYNITDPKQEVKLLIEYFSENKNKIFEVKKKIKKSFKLAKVLIKNNDSKDFEKLYKVLKKVWPIIIVSRILGDDSRDNVKGVDKGMVKEYIKIRKETDGILDWGRDVLFKQIEESLDKENKKWANFLSFNEIITKKYPKKEELEKRKRGYLYYRGKIYLGKSLDDFAKINNFVIKKELKIINTAKATGEIKGSVAYKGFKKGIVKLVLEKKDINEVKEGDILVSSMTTPDFLPAINKASAFVTDEGGITSHAAISAREIGKPCIIGTKIATQVLKDGDLVEVDADNGVVRILERSKNKKV